MIWNGRRLKEKAKPAFWEQKIYISEKEVGKISCNAGESTVVRSCNVLDSNILRKRIVNAHTGLFPCEIQI